MPLYLAYNELDIFCEGVCDAKDKFLVTIQSFERAK
jgi:hypothetical protein